MNPLKVSHAVKEQTALLEGSFLAQSQELAQFARQLVDTFNQGGRLLLIGSGPLAAVANLTANLFLHRLNLERPALPALSLSHDHTLGSSLARDHQSRLYFTRQLRALANPGDIVLLFSDGQRDEALNEALPLARQLGCKTAALCPDKTELPKDSIDFGFTLKTTSAPRATEAALFFGHLLCELAEGELFGI